MDSQCSRCDGKCCRYFCFEIDEPDDYGDFEDVRWYLCHDGVSVHVDDGDWYISINNPCKMLGPDSQCAIYEERPMICRGYDMGNCDFTAGDYGYDELFETPEQLDEYAMKTLGKKKYAKAREKARAKVVRKALKTK